MNHPATPGEPDENIEFEAQDPGLDPAVLRRRRDLVLTILAGLVSLSVAVFSAQKFIRARPRAEADILLVVQNAVKRDMGPAVSIQFAPESRKVTTVGAGLYQVSGMFVAVGRQGSSRYFAFDCSVQDTAQGVLQATSVNITPLF
jgi:hypothetical protein